MCVCVRACVLTSDTPFGGGPNARTVFEVYLKPWRDYAKVGGRGVMASHNMINWIPCHANKQMLTDVLRDRFGLDGGESFMSPAPARLPTWRSAIHDYAWIRQRESQAYLSEII